MKLFLGNSHENGFPHLACVKYSIFMTNSWRIKLVLCVGVMEFANTQII